MPRHSGLPGNTDAHPRLDDTLLLFGLSVSLRRCLPDADPVSARVSPGKGLPVTGSWVAKEPTHHTQIWAVSRPGPHPCHCSGSHTLLNGLSRLLASFCFLLEKLQLFHFNQPVTQQSISVTSECNHRGSFEMPIVSYKS
jgi:hypothetical protein